MESVSKLNMALINSLDTLEYRLKNKDSLFFAMPRINRAIRQVEANLSRIQNSNSTLSNDLLEKISSMQNLLLEEGSPSQKQTSKRHPLREKIANIWASTFPSSTLSKNQKIKNSLTTITRTAQTLTSAKTPPNQENQPKTPTTSHNTPASKPPLSQKSLSLQDAADPLIQKYKAPIDESTQNHINAILNRVEQIPEEQRVAICQATALLTITPLPIEEILPLLKATASLIKEDFDNETISALIESLLGQQNPIDLCKKAAHLIKEGMNQQQATSILLFVKTGNPTEDLCKAAALLIKKKTSPEEIFSILRATLKIPEKQRDAICSFAANNQLHLQTPEITLSRLNAATCLATKIEPENLTSILTHLDSLEIKHEHLESFCQTAALYLTPTLNVTNAKDFLCAISRLPQTLQKSTAEAALPFIERLQGITRIASISPLPSAVLEELHSIENQTIKQAICQVVADKTTPFTPLETIKQKLSLYKAVYESVAKSLKPEMTEMRITALLKALERVPPDLRTQICTALESTLNTVDPTLIDPLILKEMEQKGYVYNHGDQKYHE